MEEHLEEGQPATAPSPLDHYIGRPTTPHFDGMALLHFVQHHSMPKSVGDVPCLRCKAVVVTVRPFCSPDPDGPNYEQYCKQKLMLHRPFREYYQLLTGFDTHAAQPRLSTSTSNLVLLQGKQRLVYDTVCQHVQSASTEPLRMIVSGTAGTGKSYLIHCLRSLLQTRVRIVAPSGVAAFNVEGVTLHSFLHLPVRGDFKNLEGERLQHLQQDLTGVDYLIIDEISMVGRKLFGQVDQRLRQAFPHRAQEVLGGCSCVLVGDFGQLSPVMDQPLYTCQSKTATSDLGRATYQTFHSAVTLTQVMRQNGDNSSQVHFRELLLHLRDATVTVADWELR